MIEGLLQALQQAFCDQIDSCHVQQLSGNSQATVALFRINGADIGSQIPPAVEVIFDRTKAADDLAAVRAQKPTRFGVPARVRLYALRWAALGTPHLL